MAVKDIGGGYKEYTSVTGTKRYSNDGGKTFTTSKPNTSSTATSSSSSSSKSSSSSSGSSGSSTKSNSTLSADEWFAKYRPDGVGEAESAKLTEMLDTAISKGLNSSWDLGSTKELVNKITTEGVTTKWDELHWDKSIEQIAAEAEFVEVLPPIFKTSDGKSTNWLFLILVGLGLWAIID